MQIQTLNTVFKLWGIEVVSHSIALTLSSPILFSLTETRLHNEA